MLLIDIARSSYESSASAAEIRQKYSLKVAPSPILISVVLHYISIHFYFKLKTRCLFVCVCV